MSSSEGDHVPSSPPSNSEGIRLAGSRLSSSSGISSPLNYPQNSSGSSEARSAKTASSTLPSHHLPPRNDLGGDSFTRLYSNHSGSDADPSTPFTPASNSLSSDNPLSRSVIWGTLVNVQDVWEMFKDFLENYTDANGDRQYQTMIHTIKEAELHELNLDTQHIREYAPARTLCELLVKYPQEVVPIMDFVVYDYMKTKFPDYPSHQRVQIRPFNLEHSTNLRELNPYDVDKLVSIKGLVTRTSNVIPDIKEGFFKCSLCEFTVVAGIERGRITEPERCQKCRSLRSMNLVHNRCKFADKQIVRLQETPDSVPDGQTPHTVTLIAFDNLVDVPRAGDRIEVTGIYRAQPARIIPTQRTVRSVYRTYVDVVHYKLTDKKRMRVNKLDKGPNEYLVEVEAEETRAEQEELERKIHEISQRPDVYDVLTKSLAPSIWEMDTIKKGILCQLFGGSNKAYTKAGSSRFRGELNVLLCGDPGTSKSQMLQYVHKIAPRGIYTSGKGSSAVGLTASVTKDPETRQHVLESGALVLSDGGICCIDEFDKMSDSARSVLHEVMEQQTVSVAKAGIICTLNARTSVLASANPIHSRYDRNLSVVENIDLPPTLLSRFDLIFIILDIPREANDRKLAAHLTSLYQKAAPKQSKDVLPVELLSAYISYAREKIHPVLGDVAAKDLVDSYVDMRKLGQGSRTITATPRQLESLIRLSEALAKMRLSNVVERRDVVEAVRLIKEAQQSAATDPITGLIDLDLINTGTSAASRRMHADLTKEIRQFLVTHPNPSYKFNKLLKDLNEGSSLNIRAKSLFESLLELQDENFLTVAGRYDSPNCFIRLTPSA